MKLIFPAVLLLALIVSLPIAQHHYSRINIHNFVANDMHGEEVKFSEFDGTVLLIVNTATQCGLTEQFIGLQELYKTYRTKGFEIIAFPSDSFKQEPLSTRDVVSFCNDHFLVEFPIFEKIDIRGQYQASIYSYLADETDPDFQGPVKWNFEKFLVDGDGDVIGRFDPETEPGDPVLVKAIEDALAGS